MTLNLIDDVPQDVKYVFSNDKVELYRCGSGDNVFYIACSIDPYYEIIDIKAISINELLSYLMEFQKLSPEECKRIVENEFNKN